MPVLATTDEQAVRRVLEQMGAAWVAGDADAYAELFAPDAHYVTAPGARDIGREAIRETHRKIFATIFRGTRLGSGYPVKLQPVRDGIVLVHSSGAVLFPGEDERRVPPNGLLTMLVVREGDVWRVAAFANTPTGRARSVRFLWRYLASRPAARHSRVRRPSAPSRR
jgi:uncharacterized protein (TIGR02246 family)